MSNMQETYGHDFYKDRHKSTVYSAKTVIPLVLQAIPQVRSAIDFGCGVGTWLSVLKELGAEEVRGLDGSWVERDLLEIAKEEFHETNFESKITLDKKYDLAMTLEVAEHISQEKAPEFVESLTSASDFVLFSAAIPLQGGSGHVNEQWQDYWAKLFLEKGYVPVDLVRRQIWEDRNIPIWYRQNMLMYVNKTQLDKIQLSGNFDSGASLPVSVVHPETFMDKIEQLSSLKGSWKQFRRALKRELFS